MASVTSQSTKYSAALAPTPSYLQRFFRAATPEAVLVLLVRGGNGSRLGKPDDIEGRKGHNICIVEGCGPNRNLGR